MNYTFLIVYNVVQIAFVALLFLAVLYIFIFAFAGLFFRQPHYPESPSLKRIAVLIPGYKEDDVILEVAADALKQDYPSHLYDVIIIADSFESSTLQKLKELPVIVIEVKFEKSTKSKALNKAMAGLPDGHYDIAVILDADNLMATDFLSKLNATFEKDFIAVQGHRTAKNLNTSLAILDAISEEINNHIFRKGHRVLGLSSAIIGSGMAFRYQFFKELMSGINAIGGFDKEIELKMLKNRHTIEYLDDALVYDEKVQKAEVFTNQRRRWLSAQLHYFRTDFLTSLLHLFTRGNVDYFDKAIQFIQPPRVLLLGAVLLLGILFFWVNLVIGSVLIYNILWAAVVGLCVLAFIFSVPKSYYSKETLKALVSLPAGMLLMFGSLLKIRGANEKFIHTKHGTSDKTVVINRNPKVSENENRN